MDSRGERANYHANRSGLILQKKIRKFAQNKHTDKQTNTQTENSKPEATLIPVDSRGERANFIYLLSFIVTSMSGNGGLGIVSLCELVLFSFHCVIGPLTPTIHGDKSVLRF